MLRREAGPSRKLINPFFFWLRAAFAYLCCRAWLTRTDAQQEVDRDHLSCRRLGETLAGRWSPEQLTDQHLTPAPADAGWTRNSWSQSGAPQRQVAPVPYPLSLYTALTLWMSHNSSPPPNLSPRFAFGRSFPRWMLVFSQHRHRFFDQKMCPASRWYFLNKHSIFFFFHCSVGNWPTLLERDQSGLSCHCFLVGLLIYERIRA